MAQPPYGYAAPGVAYGARPKPKLFTVKEIIGIALAVTFIAISITYSMLNVARKGIETRFDDLKVGDCFTESDSVDSNYSNEYVVDCTVAHDSEVFYTVKLPYLSYKTDDAVAPYVKDNCDPAFKDYVGIDYADSIFRIRYLHSDTTTWMQGNLTVVCYVLDTAGDRTSSVKGTAQ